MVTLVLSLVGPAGGDERFDGTRRRGGGGSSLIFKLAEFSGIISTAFRANSTRLGCEPAESPSVKVLLAETGPSSREICV